MKYLSRLLAVFLFQSCVAQPLEKLPSNADNNSLLWEISGKGIEKPSFLFGTFHLMCKEDIVFSKALKEAIHQSKEVYFEMDLDDPANTLGALLFMNMKNGTSLKDLYTPQEYERLAHFFKDSIGTTLTMLNRMKPNFLEALLYPKMMPCKTMSGVEEELMKIAAKEKKEIKGFETIAFQAAVFDSIPYEKQAKDLLESIDSMDAHKRSFDSMLLVYKNQQLASIEEMFTKAEFGIEDNREVLLDNRNKNWVKQLTPLLARTNIFMAVGAGHLVGANGLIELLKKEGYTLRPLKNKD